MTINQIYQPLYGWSLSHGIRILCIHVGNIAGTNVEGIVKMINLRRTTIEDDGVIFI